ncbi:MAG: lysylphosphatidylglycerol synthase transmembrane domain-containing protein [Verrucomicrobiota bacterium]
MRVRRRGRLRTLMAVLGSVGLLAAIVWRVEPARLVSILGHARPLFVVCSVLSSAGALGMLTIRWHLMAWLREVGDRISDSARTALIGFGLTFVLPGAVFADVAKSYHHSRRLHRPFPDLLVVCALDRFAGMLGLAGYGALVLWVVWKWGGRRAGSEEIHWRLPSPLWVAAVGVVLGMAAMVILRRPAIRSAAERGRIRMRDGWNALRDRPRLLGLAALLSIAGNLMVAGTLAFGLASVSPDAVPWGRVLWTLPLIGLAAAFPLTVGGAGAREGAAIALWSSVGIAPPVAVAACLVTLAANLFWAGIGGLLIGAPSAEPTNLREAFEHDA